MQISIGRIAKKNIRRKIFRSLAIAASVAVVAATLFAVTTVMDSVETSLKRSTERLGADIMVVPAGSEAAAKTALLSGDPSTYYMDRSIEEKVKKVKGVKGAASQLYLQTADYHCCDSGSMLLIGFDPQFDFTVTPWLAEKLKRPLKDDEAVMGRTVTAYDVGSKMRAYGRDFTIAGVLEETGMKFIDNSIFLPIDGLRKSIDRSKKGDAKEVKVMENQISSVLVKVDPETTADRVAIFIEYQVPGVKAIVSEQVISSVRRQLFILLRSILSISIILWVMALFLIAVVFSMIVNERQREIGLLRAMGAKKRDVFRLIMWEASFLSLTGGIIGIMAGGFFLFFFREFIKHALNIPYLWPRFIEFGILIVLCLILSFITGTGAALYPALKSMNMEPYAAIRKGE